MIEIKEIKEDLKGRLPEQRYRHSKGVRNEAIRLAEHYGADAGKAAIAGLVHDCCKGVDESKAIELYKKYKIKLDDITLREKGLMHAYLGAEYARHKYGINDEEILDAVRSHTTGKPNMSLLAKIIYIADYIEENREGYRWLKPMRALAYCDLDAAVLYGLETCIEYLIDKREIAHPDTFEARNFYLQGEKKCNTTRS